MAKKKTSRITAGGRVTGGQTNTIVLTQPQRGNVDIATFMRSIRLAENVDFPSRTRLYDLIADILLTDGHLAAVYNKRKSAILNQPIEFRRRGKVDERIGEQIRSPWFFNFLSDLIDTIFWGFSLFQFYRKGDWLDYFMVPRKHVDPQRRLILHNQQDIVGESFDDFDDLLAVGKATDLGLLARIMPYAIYKRNVLADWVQYAERFGQPLLEGEYDGWDQQSRQKLVDDLFELGSAGVFVRPAGTKIAIHESAQKSGSTELFDKLVTFCNEEESKAILGNTLTTQAGDTGTQALGTVQKKGEEALTRMDKQFVLNVLNYEFSDILTAFGFDTRGGEFAFVEQNDTDLKERIDIDLKLRNQLGLPISDDYFYERYGIEKPKDYEAMKKAQETDPAPDPEPVPDVQPDPTKGTPKNRLRSFFGRAPKDDEGALDW